MKGERYNETALPARRLCFYITFNISEHNSLNTFHNRMFSSRLIYSYILMDIMIQCFTNVSRSGLAAHISDCNSPRWV